MDEAFIFQEHYKRERGETFMYAFVDIWRESINTEDFENKCLENYDRLRVMMMMMMMTTTAAAAAVVVYEGDSCLLYTSRCV